MVLVTQRFQAFGPEHFGLIALFLAGFAGLVVLGLRRGDDQRFRRMFAVAIPCFTVPMQVAQLMPADFDLGASLPFQYCDLAWVVASYALWTRKPWAVALTYYWGLTLTIQGIITPSLGQSFPDPRYFMFWGMHLLTVWAAGYLTSTGSRPTWRGFRFSVGVTVAWAVAVMTFNAATGTNYGYLNRKPPGTSALDLLGPWPSYVALEVVVVVTVWALMTWPWVRRPATHPTRATVSPRSGT
jgi:hypothetical integral membrane protein (TIGR02206 family)